MDYNEYDSNGNKKKFNVDLNDKKQRARAILAVYGVIFLILIIVIRTSGITKNLDNNTNANTNTATNNVNTNTNTNTPNPKPTNGDFAFVNDSNYEFSVKLSFDGKEYLSKGKRFEDKYELTYTYEGINYKYVGTLEDIRILNVETNEYTSAELPFFYFNYYDNTILENVVSNSTFVDDKYQITNKALEEITNNKKTDNEDALNYIKLIKRNNKIVGIEIDITNVVNASLNKTTTTTVSIEYTNFGLVENFALPFE